MAGTSVPTVLPALHAMFRDVMPPRFAVYLGDPPGGDIPDAYVAVAYGGDDRPGVVGAQSVGTQQNWTQVSAEEFMVWCTISRADGEQRADRNLAKVREYLDVCMDALRADRTVRGSITPPGVADLGTYEWSIEDGGGVCTVMFTVNVTARWVV